MDQTEEVGEPIVNQSHLQAATLEGGVSGWLFVLALGVVVNPIYIGYDLFTFHPRIYQDAFPGSIFPVLSFSADYLLVILTSFGLYLFLRRRKSFRKFYIWTLLIVAILYLVVTNAFFIDINNAVASGRMDKTLGDTAESQEGSIAGRAILVAIIWVPYLIRSKRVRATYTR